MFFWKALHSDAAALVPQSGKEMANKEHTLYCKKPGLLIIDEVHEYRNSGNKHAAVLELSMQTATTLAATATPVITKASVSWRR